MATICTRCDWRAALAIAPASTFASVALATLSVCVAAAVFSSVAGSRLAFLTMGRERPEESDESRWMNSGWKAMSTSSESLRYVRAMQMAFVAWLHDCGPTAIRQGHSTGIRACAAMSCAVSRGLVLAPILVRLLPRLMRSIKSGNSEPPPPPPAPPQPTPPPATPPPALLWRPAPVRSPPPPPPVRSVPMPPPTLRGSRPPRRTVPGATSICFAE
mmetsp:Transcript_18892/g.48171  ORF Transcript_18892/g.48171 Transcript_18892/m.48171 type:complete len:216 (-) Transcript_18892:92-739(-)